MSQARAGYTLAEATTALLVAGLLTLCLAGVLSAIGRVAIRYAQTAGAAETERIVMAVMGAELRALTASDASFAADSVRLRAFRGGGAVCSGGGALLVVGYRGVRLPEHDKDSVLLVWPDGEAAVDLTAVRAADRSCGDAEDSALLLAIDRPLSREPPVVALVYETGAYSIAASALRYRRGAAGRQPLTDQNLSSAGSTLRHRRLEGEVAAADVTLRFPESRRVPARPWRIRMPQGNRRPPLRSP